MLSLYRVTKAMKTLKKIVYAASLCRSFNTVRINARTKWSLVRDAWTSVLWRASACSRVLATELLKQLNIIGRDLLKMPSVWLCQSTVCRVQRQSDKVVRFSNWNIVYSENRTEVYDMQGWEVGIACYVARYYHNYFFSTNR